MTDEDQVERPRKKSTGPPILAVVVILGSLYILWALREETAYFFESRTPEELSVSRVPPDGHNRFARVQGVPDRGRTVIMEGRWGRHRAIFRLLGTRSRLFVAQTRKHYMAPATYTDVFEGRLLRMAQQDYFPQLYKYFVDHMTTVVDVPKDQILEHAGEPEVALMDRAGEPIRLTGGDELFISVGFAGEYRVQFDRERYPKERESDTVMADLGLPWGPLEDSRTFRSYVVRADDGQAATLMERFRDVQLKIGVVPRSAAVRCRWSDLRRVAGEVVVEGLDDPLPTPFVPAEDGLLRPAPPPRQLALGPSGIRSAEVQIPFRIPRDAMVLIEGDAPPTFWYIAAADVLLLGLVTMNIIALLRRRSGTTE